jgi:folate-binding protein YgfZ
MSVTQPGRAVHYGDPRAEYAAVRTSAGVADLTGECVVEVAGPDHVEFVQGQISQEYRGKPLGAADSTCLLNARGRVQAVARVARFGDRALLVAPAALAGHLEERLRRFIVFDQVEVKTLTSEVRVLSFQGPRARETWERLGLPGDPPGKDCAATVEWRGARLVGLDHDRTGSGGLDLIVERGHAPAVLDSLGGLPRVGLAALEVARVEAGLPAYGAEAGEAVLPQECGLEYAISYTKGCYTGQEIMARIESRGNVRRRLRVVRILAAEPPDVPESVWAGSEVGVLTSAVRAADGSVVGLAIIRDDARGGALRAGSEPAAPGLEVLERPVFPPT